MMRKRTGNKGFSLVELLVGVTILAIVIIPILHAFLTSQNTSNKARDIRNQTMAAQNVIESYEATDIGNILNNLAASKNSLGSAATITKIEKMVPDQYGNPSYQLVPPAEYSTLPKDGSGYRVYLTDVGGGTKTYDAVLKLDASKYDDRNKDLIVDYKPMDAVIPQPTDAKSNPDVIAAIKFASDATVDTGTEVSPDYFREKMNRTITITIQSIGGETGAISATAEFHYETQYPVPDPTSTPSQPKTIWVPDATDAPALFSANASARENGEYGFYFFYYPNNNSMHDTIKVINEENINISVYLIRQSTDDSLYNPTISLTETYVSGKTPQHATIAQLHYNNVASKTYPYMYYEGRRISGVWKNYYNTRYEKPDTFPKGFDGVLVDTKAQNHMYKVTVDIYNANTGCTGTLLASFDASSLQWKNELNG